ncbi:histidinol-phosphatase HisJ family protein [Inediibacterium massiliense]|uniref:histidinol-phosphatase HisJ family protein n=1 Tax=Inediibacterium massiliense TaxID=1658111 RepID=UPI0006B664BC|nr:histidinol-phosphatase HisJ family protein [Inediibacterium massiliense]
MYDYHVHTCFSPDSSMNIERAIEKAISMGLKEVAFTDHGEISVWRPDKGIVDEVFHIPTYIEKLQELKIKYKNQIGIKIGMEIGLQKEEKERIDTIISKYPFDFVIGSSHTIQKYDLFFKKIFKDRTKEEAYDLYFKEVEKITQIIDSYSVYGHIDVIRRYAYGEYEDISIGQRHIEQMKRIFKIIIEKGKGIEVNTSGFRYGIGTNHPDVDLLKLYKDLGGEIITVGSDAHKEEDIGYRIKETYKILRDLGYKYITTFEDMKPMFVKL